MATNRVDDTTHTSASAVVGALVGDGNAARLTALLCGARGGVRGTLRWLNRRRSLVALVQATREVIPGDSSFGDPMSTAGTSPTHALGRQAWRLQDGRLSLFSELMLAGLQLADWLGEDVRGVGGANWQSILFADLRAFSQWALDSDDAEVATLLRSVDAIVTEIVEAHDGVIVKRLGDGIMAVFPQCPSAVEAAFESIAAVAKISVAGYLPRLRAGVHVGRPYRIGQDFVGVDVNIAARLCEAAPAGGVLISGRVHEQLGDSWPAAPAPEIKLRGVPDHVLIYFARPPGLNDRREKTNGGDHQG